MTEEKDTIPVNEFRKDMNEVARETGWTIRRFAFIFAGTIIALSILGFGLNSAGLIGRTVVERVVFEESYQRSEAMKARIATDVAVLAEIEGKLKNPNLDESTRFNLEAQASAARIRIATAEEMK